MKTKAVEEENIKERNELRIEFDYFCSRLSFRDSLMDNRAIQFMNNFNDLVKKKVNSARADEREKMIEIVMNCFKFGIVKKEDIIKEMLK